MFHSFLEPRVGTPQTSKYYPHGTHMRTA
ncbi:uncharacterized, partial [Tachysurus ichikawai]